TGPPCRVQILVTVHQGVRVTDSDPAWYSLLGVAVLLLRAFHRFDGAIVPIAELTDLYTPQVRLSLGECRVVVEHPPLALELEDGVVRRPAHDGGEDDVAVGERIVRIGVRGVSEQV